MEISEVDLSSRISSHARVVVACPGCADAGHHDASSVDDAADSAHFREGVIVVVVGDTGDRVDFITGRHERFINMLEHAISVLRGLPDGSGDSDTYDPGGGVAIPSGGGQTLGGSGRFH